MYYRPGLYDPISDLGFIGSGYLHVREFMGLGSDPGKKRLSVRPVVYTPTAPSPILGYYRSSYFHVREFHGLGSDPDRHLSVRHVDYPYSPIPDLGFLIGLGNFHVRQFHGPRVRPRKDIYRSGL